MGTRWKRGLAPGSFLYTIDSTIVAPKLRGIQWMYGGTSWEWYHPVRHRDRLTTRVKLLDAVERQGGRARSFIAQTGESLYYDGAGTLVARALGSTARTPRARALGVKLRRPNIFGDVSWCRGRVAGKRVEDGVHLVDLEIHVENQLGEKTATATATAEPPSAHG